MAAHKTSPVHSAAYMYFLILSFKVRGYIKKRKKEKTFLIDLYSLCRIPLFNY